jgi:hypothetical protein
VPEKIRTAGAVYSNQYPVLALRYPNPRPIRAKPATRRRQSEGTVSILNRWIRHHRQSDRRSAWAVLVLCVSLRLDTYARPQRNSNAAFSWEELISHLWQPSVQVQALTIIRVISCQFIHFRIRGAQRGRRSKLENLCPA